MGSEVIVVPIIFFTFGAVILSFIYYRYKERTAIIEKGRRNVEILKQGLNEPMPVEKQVAIIYCGTKGLLNDIPIEKMKEFEDQFLATLSSHSNNILNELKSGKLSDECTNTLEQTCKKIKENLTI